jgi:hypothetical protein
MTETPAIINPLLLPEATTNQLLLQIFTSIGDIKGTIGTIEGRLAVGSERHRDFAKSLDTIAARATNIETEMAKIPAIGKAVSDMEPKVADLVLFKGRMAAIVLVAGTITGAAFAFIFEGIKFFTPDIRAFIERISFH